MADDSLTRNARKVSVFSMTDIVELLGSDGPSRGRVVATRDGGSWIYVLWLERAGYRGRTTTESASDIRKLSERT
jgi:hypothetical protein